MRRTRSVTVAALVMLLVLAGCADDTGNRQFANEPRTPSPTRTADAATPITASPFVQAQALPLASPEALVESEDASETVYGLYGETLWAIDRSGRTVVATGGIEAFAASPDGDRVAVVTAGDRDAGRAYRIELYSRDGTPLASLGTVLTVPASGATPAPEGASGVSLSWSPDGERLLLAHASGALIDVPIDGAPVPIETRAPLTGIAQAIWSPEGNTVGVVIRGESGNGSLALIDTTEEPARVNVIAPVGSGKSVESFAWTDGDDGVLFLETTAGDDGRTGGTLVQWNRATNATEIVATGGQAGPTGSIAWFRLAPDGDAVLCAIAMLTGDGWVFNGLYVRSLDTGQVYRVPVDASATVANAWWLGEGIAWISVEGPPDAPEAALDWIDAGGARSQIGTISPDAAAPASASPVVATPAATPVASPARSGATPVGGTPQATPEG